MLSFSIARARLTGHQYLMVDVVTNHMGYAGCGDCVDYSIFNPFDKESFYHPFCLIDYNNQTSMELVGDITGYREMLLTQS
jgi:alpha-amylase